jgi:hypothetical protein
MVECPAEIIAAGEVRVRFNLNSNRVFDFGRLTDMIALEGHHEYSPHGTEFLERYSQCHQRASSYLAIASGLEASIAAGDHTQRGKRTPAQVEKIAMPCDPAGWQDLFGGRDQVTLLSLSALATLLGVQGLKRRLA